MVTIDLQFHMYFIPYPCLKPYPLYQFAVGKEWRLTDEVSAKHLHMYNEPKLP